MLLPKNEWHWGCEHCGKWCEVGHYPPDPHEEDHIFCLECYAKFKDSIEENQRQAEVERQLLEGESG